MELHAKFVAALIVAVAATPFSLAQQRNAPVVTLSGTGTELSEEFTLVTSVREMLDGRVVVADPCEKAVFILDFDRGSRTLVGRMGEGPGEYQLPMMALRSAGDVTLIFDIGGQKFISVNPAGDARAATSPADRSVSTRQLNFSFSTKVLTDTLGRIYANGSNSSRAPDQPRQQVDSVAITRFDPRSSLLDTVAYLAVGQVGGLRSGGTSRAGRAGAAPPPPGPDIRYPFRASATWVVAPDGSVGIIHPEPFTIEWISPQKQRLSPRALTYQPVRVTDAEKDEETNPKTESRGCSMTVSRSVPGGLIGTNRVQRSTPIPSGKAVYHWPEFKHPYANEENGALATPEGGVMILVQRTAKDSVPTYNVYDRAGTLVRRLQLPPRTRLLGLGRGTVYLARNDSNGLQYLRRYRIAG